MMRKMLALSLVMISGGFGAAGVAPTDAGPLPADFPAMTAHIYDPNAIADGYLFLTVSTSPGAANYLMVLKNDGTPVWYGKTAAPTYNLDVQPNGLATYAQVIGDSTASVGGVDAVYNAMDETFSLAGSFQMSNGYTADAHDFSLLANGHALMFGYYFVRADMSRRAVGGYPNAQVSGAVIQEVDDQGNAIFQWRSWDHYDVNTFPFDSTKLTQATIGEFQVNAISMDWDGNILIGSTEWAKKISRQTGEILWHLGGSENQFRFVGVDPNEAVRDFGGSNAHRLANGNVLVYTNGGPALGTLTSQVHEYALDEVNKVATLVWTYTPQTPIPGGHFGNAQRLPNGNTLIGWGGAGGAPIPTCTEVTPDGRKVYELFFNDPNVQSSRVTRFVYPPQNQAITVQKYELAVGNTYTFTKGSANTGVSLEVLDLAGELYNTVTITREPYAPLFPSFPGKAPRVPPVRVTLDSATIESMTERLSFDCTSFGFEDANVLTVYYRPFAGHGLFIPLATDYNPVTRQLRATADGFGEFAFGYPDLEEIPLAPTLVQPRDGGTVNQTLPVTLEWTPNGFAGFYELQVARDANFADVVLDEPYLTSALYSWPTGEPNRTYHWRVNTTNEGGTSDWSVASFATVPPFVTVTAPNGGQSWQRGLSELRLGIVDCGLRIADLRVESNLQSALRNWLGRNVAAPVCCYLLE